MSSGRFLLDSNIIIYSSKPEFDYLRHDYIGAQASVSIVSKIEVLGFHSLDEVAKTLLQDFFTTMTVLPLSDDIATLAIFLRQQRSVTLGDAVIAATALIEDNTLNDILL